MGTWPWRRQKGPWVPDAAIISTVYDGYDTIKPVWDQTGLDVEWVLVTDAVPDALAARGWRIVHAPRPDLDPYRASKVPKCQPWRFTKAPMSIYIDASFQVMSPTFASDALEAAARSGMGIAQFVHPWRNCAYDEGRECLGLAKYASEWDKLRAQLAWYEKAQFPKHWGLWASGCIARHHTPQIKLMGERWLRDIETWSHQCQVSEPPALLAAYLRPNRLTGTHLDNPWLTYLASARHG